MDINKTTYCALYKDGSFVEKDTLEELDVVPAYSFLLQVDTIPNSYNLHFKPITREGNLTTIRIGNFEIINMRPQNSYKDYYGMSITIFDYIKESAFVFNSRSTKRLDVFKNEIFPLMNKLNELGSWENYENQLKVQDLKRKNEEMSMEIKLLKEKIRQMEESRGKTDSSEEI